MSGFPPPQLANELVLANRILSNEGVLDAFGHVSARHPSAADRFLISHARAPELVEADDLQLFDLDGARVAGGERRSYEEVAIHAAVYRHRPDVGAVVHSHAPSVIPFSVTAVPLRPIYHMGSVIGHEIPVWDIAKRFGETDLLVRDARAADDLVAELGGRTVVLMRGHGCVVTGADLRAAVFAAVYLERNATLLATALRLGEVHALSKAETQRASEMLRGHAGERAWEYWVRRLPQRTAVDRRISVPLMKESHGPTQAELDRLTADLRVFDANGIERAAWGWDRYERRGLDEYHGAERAALALIEQHDVGPRWEEFRRTLFGLTESAGALVNWKAKHGQLGHKAERAAFGAALGLFAREHLTREQYASLVEPMAEALPWLLPDRPPAPRPPKS